MSNLAGLEEHSQVEGVRIPVSVCLTTARLPPNHGERTGIGDLLDWLSLLKPDGRAAIRARSAEIRRTIGATAIPADLTAAVLGAHSQNATGESEPN
jgi:pyruvate,water dikinase